MNETRYIEDHGPHDATARFSRCQRYRYLLTRWLTTERVAPRTVVFLMLNPSTADAFRPDPTVSKCIAFAQRWGFDRLEVVNLFALRSPDPGDLYRSAAVGVDVIGEANEAHILSRCADADLVIAAWGNHGHDARLPAERGSANGGRTRGGQVRIALESEGIELHCLGTTGSGAPLHPLARGKNWIPLDRDPVRWGPA